MDTLKHYNNIDFSNLVSITLANPAESNFKKFELILNEEMSYFDTNTNVDTLYDEFKSIEYKKKLKLKDFLPTIIISDDYTSSYNHDGNFNLQCEEFQNMLNNISSGYNPKYFFRINGEPAEVEKDSTKMRNFSRILNGINCTEEKTEKFKKFLTLISYGTINY